MDKSMSKAEILRRVSSKTKKPTVIVAYDATTASSTSSTLTTSSTVFPSTDIRKNYNKSFRQINGEIAEITSWSTSIQEITHRQFKRYTEVIVKTLQSGKTYCYRKNRETGAVFNIQPPLKNHEDEWTNIVSNLHQDEI